MKSVTIREAKTRRTELAGIVERSETIVVTRDGAPLFDMTPHRPKKGLRLQAIENSSGSMALTPWSRSSRTTSTIRCPRTFFCVPC